MKNLILIRHAKSSWENSELSDKERPLNKRGYEDSPFMGEILHKKKVKIDKIFSSSAIRARQTIELIAKKINYPIEKIVFDDRLYHASRRDLINFITEIDNNYETIALVGHNPGLSDLASYLLDDFNDDLPTCSILAISGNCQSWRDFPRSEKKLLFYLYPKKFK